MSQQAPLPPAHRQAIDETLRGIILRLFPTPAEHLLLAIMKYTHLRAQCSVRLDEDKQLGELWIMGKDLVSRSLSVLRRAGVVRKVSHSYSILFPIDKWDLPYRGHDEQRAKQLELDALFSAVKKEAGLPLAILPASVDSESTGERTVDCESTPVVPGSTRSRHPYIDVFDSNKAKGISNRLGDFQAWLSDGYIREKLSKPKMHELSMELTDGATKTARQFELLYQSHPDEVRRLVGSCAAEADFPCRWMNEAVSDSVQRLHVR